MSYFNSRTSRRPVRGQRNFGNSRNSNRRVAKKSYIHPSRFIQQAKPREEVVYQPNHSFDDFSVQDLLKNNLKIKGIQTPSAIQDQAIPHILQGCDVVGIANTGTGKTIAFGLPLLNGVMIDPTKKALILAPTRELAQQIEAEFMQIAKDSGLLGALLIGGTSMRDQLRDLKFNPAIVIGTPGRIKDHMARGSLDLSGFNMVVLDEVDRMLDMGFVADMQDILGAMDTDRQSLFFSATLDNRVQGLIQTFGRDPVTISVKTGVTSENVEQDIMPYGTNDEKILQLHNLLISEDVSKVLVFDETQRSVERLHNELVDRGFKADAIHGGKSQGQRQRALDKFKKSHVKILVATDVAARGIDVSDITHVVNYTQPQTYEDYVHRIGRAGRAGRIGYAFTFVKA